MSHQESTLKAGISVVIPTYNRKDLLERTLLSLLEQTLDKSLFEVIVVDDGSSDGSDLLVQEFQSKIPIKYFFQDDDGFRVAKARNLGIQHVEFSTILFFDSGMIASSKLLQLHFDRQKAQSDLIIIGLSFGVNEYDTRCANEIEEIIQNNSIDNAFEKMGMLPQLKDCRIDYLTTINFQLECTSIPWILFWTGHVSVSTSAVKRVGGFDEWFHSWGGEDVELGLRLFQLGCRFELLSSIESLHYPHAKDAAKKQAESQKNIQYIHQKHQLESTRLLLTMNWEELIKLNF